MKHLHGEFSLLLKEKPFFDFTRELKDFSASSGIKNGIIMLCAEDGGCALALTCAMDEKGIYDAMDELRRCAPARIDRSDKSAPFEIAGRVRSALTASTVPVSVVDGKPVLGIAQSVLLLNFYGSSERRVYADMFEFPEAAEKRLFLNTEFLGAADITDEIEGLVADSGIKRGLCHIAVKHTTAGVALLKEGVDPLALSQSIETMIPTRADFRHRETAYDASGHIKAAVTGCCVLVPVEDGKAVWPRDTRAVFTEFDGPRRRSVTVSIFGKGELS